MFLFAGAAAVFDAIPSLSNGNSPDWLMLYLVAAPILFAIGARYALRAFGRTVERPPSARSF